MMANDEGCSAVIDGASNLVCDDDGVDSSPVRTAKAGAAGPGDPTSDGDGNDSCLVTTVPDGAVGAGDPVNHRYVL